MAKIRQELAIALPSLTKAVFSQPVDKALPTKVELRPLILKGERVYQVERFENNKAFHENLKATPHNSQSKNRTLCIAANCR